VIESSRASILLPHFPSLAVPVDFDEEK